VSQGNDATMPTSSAFETRAEFPRARRAALGNRSCGLSSLPLTRRESEIPAYVAVGKTNSEIGIILGISWRTVEKHMEHILARLGVETRTAAAASALKAANI
jgi:DNA-binding NarL/FixJ family response regulator